MAKQFIRAYRSGEAGGDGPLRFVAATEGIGRDGLIIDGTGWQLEAYRANPVVLWAHDYTGQRPPIGRAEVTMDEGSGNLLADVTFDHADPFAADIERKYRSGFLNAVSVGWNTLEMKPASDGRSLGTVTRAELLDISAVPVPGDPGALMERQARALADLGETLARLTDEPKPVADRELTEEVDWAGTAALMARLFLDTTEETEAERKARWTKLARRYERMGKTAPEYLTAAETDVLGPDELRGLFLEGEAEVVPFPGEVVTRAGAMLSSRNKSDLEQAMTLIRSVLDRAEVVKETERDAGEADARTVAALEELRARLKG